MDSTNTDPTVPSTIPSDTILTDPAIPVDADIDTLAEFFNDDGSLTDAAYEYLHREWATGRMI